MGKEQLKNKVKPGFKARDFIPITGFMDHYRERTNYHNYFENEKNSLKTFITKLKYGLFTAYHCTSAVVAPISPICFLGKEEGGEIGIGVVALETVVALLYSRYKDKKDYKEDREKDIVVF